MGGTVSQFHDYSMFRFNGFVTVCLDIYPFNSLHLGKKQLLSRVIAITACPVGSNSTQQNV